MKNWLFNVTGTSRTEFWEGFCNLYLLCQVTFIDTIGLTQQEIYEHLQMNTYEDDLTGTVSGDAEEIRVKSLLLTWQFIQNYIMVGYL